MLALAARLGTEEATPNRHTGARLTRARRRAAARRATLLAIPVALAAAAIACGSPEEAAPAATPEAEALPPLSAEQREAVLAFADVWRERRLPFGNRWLGIHTIQNPLDVWITQEIFFEVRPDFVVETGTHAGGSALLWATILEQINPEGRVLTVDIEDRTKQARADPLWKRRIEFLHGSSTDPAIVARVAEQVKGKRVVVILDSLHKRDHVLQELRMYSPFVNPGSYLIVQDTGVAEATLGIGWAGDAVQAFLKENPDFRPDESRERLLVTNNSGGFLKRIR